MSLKAAPGKSAASPGAASSEAASSEQGPGRRAWRPPYLWRPGAGRYDRPVATPRTRWAPTATGRACCYLAVGALALVAAAAGCGGPGTGGSPDLAVTVTSHGGPSLTATVCTVDASGGTVTAIGRVDGSASTALSLNLDVLSATKATLVVAGAAHTATVPAGSKAWLVQTRVTPGFPPARCVVTATDAEVLVTLTVTSASMTPTVAPGGRVIVDAGLRHGHPTDRRHGLGPPPVTPACAPTGGRPAGRPGDRAAGTDGGGHRRQVTVDGAAPAEPWLRGADRTRTADFGPVTVGTGDYFVMGDNRADAVTAGPGHPPRGRPGRPGG